jgi:hypothetical protein
MCLNKFENCVEKQRTESTDIRVLFLPSISSTDVKKQGTLLFYFPSYVLNHDRPHLSQIRHKHFKNVIHAHPTLQLCYDARTFCEPCKQQGIVGTLVLLNNIYCGICV